MATLTLYDLPEEVISRLQQRARAHGVTPPSRSQPSASCTLHAVYVARRTTSHVPLAQPLRTDYALASRNKS